MAVQQKRELRDSYSSGMPSPDQRVRMQRDGYVVAPGLLGRQQVAQLLEWTEELERAPQVSGKHWVYHEPSLTAPPGAAGQALIQRIENFCPYHEGFDRFVRNGLLATWTGALMGGPVVLFKDKINFKKPGGSGFAAHQDQQAGWGAYASVFVTAMVTLDATTLENGCLEVAAGWRRSTQLVGEEWKPLNADDLDLQPVPTEPGDVIFFDSFVPHASGPNITSRPRRVLYLTYNLAREGDQRARYFADKHAAFPPDIDRDPDKVYVFRV